MFAKKNVMSVLNVTEDNNSYIVAAKGNILQCWVVSHSEYQTDGIAFVSVVKIQWGI